MDTIVENYLFSTQITSINNKKLANKCFVIEDTLNKTTKPVPKGIYGNIPSAKNKQYNLFTFSTTELVQLYNIICEKTDSLLEKDTSYVIKSWMNIYRKGESIGWHDHWPAKDKVWHGFYCVNTEEVNSSTLYKIPGVAGEVDVPSKDGLLVVGKSDNDKHRSTPWYGKTPRITLAFDIVPVYSANPNENSDMSNLHLYHYVPMYRKSKHADN